MKGNTDTILMIRPRHFGSNPDTIVDNHFQDEIEDKDKKSVMAKATEEFDGMVAELVRHDITVIVIEDELDRITPDSVFPNNWISSHSNGCLVTYPMKGASRRLERREDIVDKLTDDLGYRKRYGFEYHEQDEIYLEGTGSMILDRVNKVVYAGLSARTDIKILEKFTVLFGYQKVIFHATDPDGYPIYHTNVMMSIADKYAVICLDAIKNKEERALVVQSLENSSRTIIEISFEQMKAFAGNMLQVRSKLGQPYMIMSHSAYNSLNISQIDLISSFNKIIHIPIPTIEKYGGGSVRCMMMEVFPPE